MSEGYAVAHEDASVPQKLRAQHTGYELLSNRIEAIDPTQIILTPNPAYEQYLKMHKVFVGKRGAENLETIHSDLASETMPRYLCAAGWAAAEAAIVQKDRPTLDRLQLLDAATECWERAIEVQRKFNELDTNQSHLIEHSAPYRMAVDIAVTPLLRGLILGQITDDTCRAVFEDCINIAQANQVQLDLAARSGDTDAENDHLGFAHECNAMLSLNRMNSKSWFAIPAMARSDSGYYYPEQTHDLLVIRRRAGEIQSLVPVEVKAKASLRDRKRYLALLVRGKMHLCVEEMHRPRATLQAIAASYDGTATKHEQTVADTVSHRFMQMLNDYYEGEVLGNKVAGGELTVFHDKTLVAERHPGLGTIAIDAA